MAKVTYKDSGVNLDVYRESMGRIGHWLRRTHTPRVMPLEGGFAGLFELDFPGRLFARNYRQPVLVACTDGVGTKLKVAQRAGKHDTVGLDLVGMCVNDCICLGAEPLFFLDYVAQAKDDPDQLEALLKGISNGCVEADCALLGGETAILPDVYHPGEYDLAGFCVGVVERDRIIDGKQIQPGDKLIGLASSGIHSNGYSLVRKIVFDVAGLDVGNQVPSLGQTVGEALLAPTLIYVKPLRKVLSNYRVKQVVHGIAHITGGGLAENLERILPENIQAEIQMQAWPRPAVFQWLQSLGNVEEAEMRQVFNLGIGLVLVVSPHFSESILRQLADAGYQSWEIGHTAAGPRSVQIAG